MGVTIFAFRESRLGIPTNITGDSIGEQGPLLIQGLRTYQELRGVRLITSGSGLSSNQAIITTFNFGFAPY